MADIIEKEKKVIQNILDGKIGCLDIIYDCCIKEFDEKHSGSSWIIDECHKYICNYFVELYKKISDLSIEEFILLTSEETKYIRQLCKVNNDQDVSLDCARDAFNKFRKRILRDVISKVEYLMNELCNGNSAVLNMEIIGLLDMNINLGAYKHAKFYLIYDYLKLTKSELKACFSDVNYRAIVRCAYLHGLRFADEVSIITKNNSPYLDLLLARLENLDAQKKELMEKLQAISREESAIISEISKLPENVDKKTLRR